MSVRESPHESAPPPHLARIHRDLKPSNVLVTETGRVVILDFGLVNELDSLARTTGFMSCAGTPLYLSPEQAAGHLAVEASDWYAVGVMLFEVVTGRQPFTETLLPELILAKQEQVPPRPSTLAPNIDPALDDLIVGLLDRDPVARSGRDELLSWCNGIRAAPVADIRRLSKTAALKLVGREKECSTLTDALQRSLRGHPCLGLLSGASGVGKSALLRYVASLVRMVPGVVLLMGECSPFEDIPYRAFDGLMDGLCRHLRHVPLDELTGLLDDCDFEALIQVFPVLGRGLDGTGMDTLSQPFSPDDALSSDQRLRAFSALKRLLYRVALRSRLVILIDDLHWGDAESAHLLTELFSPPEVPRMMVLCSFNRDDAASAPCIQELRQLLSMTSPVHSVLQLPIEPLNLGEGTELALVRLRGVHANDIECARAIATESSGVPMLIEAFVDYLDIRAIEDLKRSIRGHELSFRRLIDLRLSSLSDAAREVLEFVAVAGQPLREDVLTHATRGLQRLRNSLAYLRNERLTRVRETLSVRLVDCYHGTIRGAVLSALDPERRRDIHGAIADALLACSIDVPDQIARHLYEGGQTEAGREIARDAAMVAFRERAYERAAALYGLALRMGGPWHLRKRCAYVCARRPEDAAHAFLTAAIVAPISKMEPLKLAAAEHFFFIGQHDRGHELLSPLLSDQGLTQASHASALERGLSAELARLCQRGFDFEIRFPMTVTSRHRDLIDLTWSAGKSLLLTDSLRAGYYILYSARLALDSGLPVQIARALALTATFMVNCSREESGRCLEAARRASDVTGGPLERGFLSINEGVMLRSAGRWLEALNELDYGLQTLREHCPGALWQRSIASTSVFVALEALGEFRNLSLRVDQFAHESRETGDEHTQMVSAAYLALIYLSRDQVDTSMQLIDRHFGGPNIQTPGPWLQFLRRAIDCDLYAGLPERAWERLSMVSHALDRWSHTPVLVRRTELLILRIRCALAMLAAHPRASGAKAQRRQIERNLDALRREPMAHAEALALE